MKIIDFNNVRFCAYLRYKDRYIPDKQDQTRDIIRAHVEEQLGPEIFYAEQLKKERENRRPSGYYTPIYYLPHKKNAAKIDLALLDTLKIYAAIEQTLSEFDFFEPIGLCFKYILIFLVGIC